MKNNTEVEVLVTLQGDAVCGRQGYMLKRSEDVAAFYLDGWGETGRIYTEMYANSTWKDGKLVVIPTIWLSNGNECLEEALTEIRFPEYEGWRVHCTSGGKTMAICLVKED